MKTAKDPRHLKRIQAVEQLFSWQFNPKAPIKNELASAVAHDTSNLDKVITDVASEWPINQINRIDLVILRLAVYELTVERSAPYKVVVDEAVELAKKYGSDSSASFINGVLGKVIQQYHLDKSENTH